MTVKVVEETFDKNQWNAMAQHPMQTWEWGEARKELGTEVVRVGEFNGAKLVNAFQMTLHKVPFVRKLTTYLPRSVYPTKGVLNFIADFAKEKNIISVKFEPYEKSDPKFLLADDRLRLSPNPLFPEWTIALNPQLEDVELLKQMHPKTRYNIRLAQKKGVVVREESNEKGFETFIHLYFDTAKRQNYYGHSYQYHKTIFESLKKAGMAHLLIAYFETVPLAAYELFTFKDTMYYAYGGSSTIHRNVMAAQLIMWESIRFAKEKKMKEFDMWGSLSPDYSETHPWAGFTRFKEGFGGEFVHLAPSVDLVTDPFFYRLFTLAYNARTAYLVAKGKLR